MLVAPLSWRSVSAFDGGDNAAPAHIGPHLSRQWATHCTFGQPLRTFHSCRSAHEDNTGRRTAQKSALEADGPLACARPDPTIGWTDVLPCVFVCVWGRYPPAAALLVRRLVVPVLNKLLQLPLHPLAGACRRMRLGAAGRPSSARCVRHFSAQTRRQSLCQARAAPRTHGYYTGIKNTVVCLKLGMVHRSDASLTQCALCQ